MSAHRKLYIVTRADLPAGLLAAQACHALRQFAHEEPEIERAWFESSNTLALLSVRDEAALRSLVREARSRGLRAAEFREPDLDHALTAVAIEPRAKSLVRRLALALSER